MPDKLSEMILYIADKSADDPAFGATKLNKLLFTIDFYAYGIFGESISGERYVHRQFGPVPARLPQARADLIANGRAIQRTRTYFGRPMKRLIPKEEPDESAFAQWQKTFMDDVIKSLRPWNGSDLSEWTHRLRPWLDTVEGEEIPFDTVFVLEDVPISRADLEWGEQRLSELKAAGYVRA